MSYYIKKLALSLILFIIFVPTISQAALCSEALFDPPLSVDQGLVPCGRALDENGSPVCPCKLEHVKILAFNVFNFLIYAIGLPLAGVVVVAGGVMLVVSAGNPGLAGQARNMIKWSLISVVLMFCSVLIMHIIFAALGVAPNFIPF